MNAYLPAIAGVAIIMLGVAWRIPWHRRMYGSSAIVVFHAAEWRERIPEIVIGTLVLVLAGEIIAWALWPQSLSSLAIVRPQAALGSLAMLPGLGLVLRAQSDLGASWRVGIDPTARPGLITHGLYRFSRNPIYLGMFVVVGGFVLMIPTVVSVLVLIGIVLGARGQVQREERYLAETYGSAFVSYTQRVGRFLPWLGRTG